MKVYTVNIFPLHQVAKRYQLDTGTFFPILMNFLSHRREEILNTQLSKWFDPYDIGIKREIQPILYQLINELDRSDNVEDYFIRNNYFYIKDHPDDPDD